MKQAIINTHDDYLVDKFSQRLQRATSAISKAGPSPELTNVKTY